MSDFHDIMHAYQKHLKEGESRRRNEELEKLKTAQQIKQKEIIIVTTREEKLNEKRRKQMIRQIQSFKNPDWLIFPINK